VAGLTPTAGLGGHVLIGLLEASGFFGRGLATSSATNEEIVGTDHDIHLSEDLGDAMTAPYNPPQLALGLHPRLAAVEADLEVPRCAEA
jgi:hypothetical protein